MSLAAGVASAATTAPVVLPVTAAEAAAWSHSIAPDLVWIFTVFRAVFAHARYRIAYRGAWVVEIRNPDSDLTPLE